MNFRCKFRHHRSIRRPRFPIRMQNFGDLATFSVDYCVLYSECPPYFYFRFVWPTDLESIPHASTPTMIIPTKFEVDMSIHCRVTVFLSADTSRDLVTSSFDHLTLNSWHTWRVTWPTMPPSVKTLRLFVHELRIITFPIDYHRKCVRGHCACAESRDPWVGGQKRLHFGNPPPRFAYSLCNFRGSTMKVITVVCENNALPYICTAHAQKRLFMNFRCKFGHHRSIPRPRFDIRVENFGDSATFSVDFWILYLNVRHISTSGLFDLLT